MTPEQVAEVLAARTPGPWYHGPLWWEVWSHNERGELEHRVLSVSMDALGDRARREPDAAAITVAVNLADEWQAVAEAARAVLNAAMADPVVGTGRHARMLGGLNDALAALDKKRESL